MPYNYATLSDALIALSARLYGSAMYTSVELQGYIIEALRTWNAYTKFWRADFVYHHPSGRRERIQADSPINTRRGALQYAEATASLFRSYADYQAVLGIQEQLND